MSVKRASPELSEAVRSLLEDGWKIVGYSVDGDGYTSILFQNGLGLREVFTDNSSTPKLASVIVYSE